MNSSVNKLVEPDVSAIRLELPPALVVFYADINRSVRSEGKDVADIDISEDSSASLKHLMTRK